MLFTDRFVYIHEPKTGGTFVTSVLYRLYGAKWNYLTHLRTIVCKEVGFSSKYGLLIQNDNKHGTCSQIPQAHWHKPILATVRNPYDLYVSQYHFGWWKRKEYLSYYRKAPEFKPLETRFPNLTFEEFVRLSNAVFREFDSDVAEEWRPGMQTQQFTKYYTVQPSQVFRRIGENHHAEHLPTIDLFDIHFIRTDQLNRELYDFLIGMGYQAEDLEFILSVGKILPQGGGHAAREAWPAYYTPELKGWVRHKERLIFSLFPEFDV